LLYRSSAVNERVKNSQVLNLDEEKQQYEYDINDEL